MKNTWSQSLDWIMLYNNFYNHEFKFFHNANLSEIYISKME